MAHEQISLPTNDGACPAHVLTPDDAGPWPAAVFYMDGLAMRPALVAMAQRLAGEGYLVLLPDMFYRFGPYPPIDPKVAFAGDLRATIAPMASTTNAQKAAADSGAFLDYLATRGDVAGANVGVFGFCMGGGMAVTAAGTFPDRVGAVASFHGGNLATDAPDSPHLLAPRIEAEVYVAGADNDASYPPEMEAKLDEALTEAGVVHRCEIYSGAAHGWMMPDFPIYNEAAAERGWAEMLALFFRTLR